MMKKFRLKEDLDDSDFDITVEPQDLYELHNEMGTDLFSNANIQSLKTSGNIVDGKIFTFDPEDYELLEMTLDDLYQLDYRFINNQFIKDLVISKFEQEYPNGLEYGLTARDVGSVNHLSDDFIESCFMGDVWEYFCDYDISFNDVNIYLIDADNLKEIEQMGFPKDILELLQQGEEDEEHPLAYYYDDLEDAVAFAAERGESDGAANECISDFDRAVESFSPDGCEFIYRDYDRGELNFKLTKEFVEDHIEYIWDRLEYVDLTESVIGEFRDTFKEEFDFREPYSGWFGFEEESFNYDLADRLDELKRSIESDTNKDTTNNDVTYEVDDEDNMEQTYVPDEEED